MHNTFKMKSAALSLIAFILTACSSVQGVVRDKPTGTPIPSAHINIKSSSAITNAMGHYRITGPFLPGDTMMVNAPGYNIYTQSLKSQNDIIDVDLSPKK